MVRSSLPLICFVFLLVGAVLWGGLSWRERSEPYVDLESPPAAGSAHGEGEAAVPDDSFRFAVASMWSPERAFLRYRRLGMRLGRMLGRKETLVIRPTYREVREDLEKGRVHAALVCTGTILNLSGAGRAEVSAVPRFRKGRSYRGLILVSMDSPARTLEDLRGKVMAFTDPESFTGCILPCAVLEQAAGPLKEFLKDAVFTGSHDASVEAVCSGFVDAAAVDGLIYDVLASDRPDVTERTRVLWQSNAFGPPAVVVSLAVGAEERERLRSILLAFHADPEGRKILRDLGIERFETPPDGAYDTARAVYRRFCSAGGCPWH